MRDSLADLAPVDRAELKADFKLRRKPTADALAGRHRRALEKPSLGARSTFKIATHARRRNLDVPAQFAEGVREPLQDVARNPSAGSTPSSSAHAQAKVTTIASAAPRMRINALTDDGIRARHRLTC